jgi:hypothetical protein
MNVSMHIRVLCIYAFTIYIYIRYECKYVWTNTMCGSMYVCIYVCMHGFPSAIITPSEMYRMCPNNM